MEQGPAMQELGIEVCVENVDDALAAESAGATRIEFNSALALEGLTPSIAACERLKQQCGLPVIAMLRLHANGFVFSPAEQQIMLRDCELLLAAGVDGIAFGALNSQGTLDLPFLRKVAGLCDEKQLVMHRAFDQLEDQRGGLEQLIDLGFRRVLTSGGAATVDLGIERLIELVQWSAGRIEILPGGGVNLDNAVQLLEITGCSQLHGTFRRQGCDRIRLNTQAVGELRSRLNRLISQSS
jgi:copper homeostasis protein